MWTVSLGEIGKCKILGNFRVSSFVSWVPLLTLDQLQVTQLFPSLLFPLLFSYKRILLEMVGVFRIEDTQKGRKLELGGGLWMLVMPQGES